MSIVKSAAWKYLAAISAVLIALLFILGLSADVHLKYAESVKDSAIDSNRIPIEKAAKFRETFEQGIGELSADQGVEVTLQAISVDGKWFDKNTDHSISDYGGEISILPNSLTIDPDLRNRGLPNLKAATTLPQPFFEGLFMERLFSNTRYVPKFLRQSLSQTGPVESFEWWSGNTRIAIQRYLYEFSLIVSTQYNTDDDFEKKIPEDITHDVFGRKFDRKREWNRQRYPPVHLLLKFTPRSPEYGAAANRKKAQFAVGAVELVEVDFPSDLAANPSHLEESLAASRRDDGGLQGDSDLFRGQLLPLYRRPSEISVYQNPAKSKLPKNVYEGDLRARLSDFEDLKGEASSSVLNSELFGRPRYSVVRIENIGTWRKGNGFVGRTKSAEVILLRFAIHMYVYGDWVARFNAAATPPTIEDFRTQYTTEASIIDRAIGGLWHMVFPSFGLGNFGRYLFIFVLLLLLAPFFPIILQLLMTIVSLSRWMLDRFRSLFLDN